MKRIALRLLALAAWAAYLLCFWRWSVRVNAGESTDFWPIDIAGPLPVLTLGLLAAALGVVVPLAWSNQASAACRTPLADWRRARYLARA